MVDPIQDILRPIGSMVGLLLAATLVVAALLILIVRHYGGKYSSSVKLLIRFVESSVIVISILVQVAKRALLDLPDNLIRKTFESLVAFQFDVPIPPSKCLSDMGIFTAIPFESEFVKLSLALLLTFAYFAVNRSFLCLILPKVCTAAPERLRRKTTSFQVAPEAKPPPTGASADCGSFLDPTKGRIAPIRLVIPATPPLPPPTPPEVQGEKSNSPDLHASPRSAKAGKS
jgi:hypothetical protein